MATAAVRAEETLVVEEQSTTLTTSESTTLTSTTTTTMTTTTTTSRLGRLWGFGRGGNAGGGEMATLEQSTSVTRRESKRSVSLMGPTGSGLAPALPSEDNKDIFDALKARIATEQAEDNVGPFNDEHLLNNVLVARNLDVDAAFKMWQGIVEWRKEYQPEKVDPVDAEAYLSLGVIHHCGPDKHGRPVIYAQSKHHAIDAEHHERNLRTIVNLLEKAKQESVRTADGYIVVIIDQEDVGRKNMDTHLFIGKPGLVHILQDFFPETLGVCILLHTGLIFRLMWAIISPFLDEKTRNKVKVLTRTEDLLDFVDPAHLPPQLQAKVGYVADK